MKKPCVWLPLALVCHTYLSPASSLILWNFTSAVLLYYNLIILLTFSICLFLFAAALFSSYSLSLQSSLSLSPCGQSGSGPLRIIGLTPQANQIAHYPKNNTKSQCRNKPHFSGGGELRLRHVLRLKKESKEEKVMKL